MALQAYDRTTGARVHVGDTVTDFRGTEGVLTMLERGESTGKSGKVVVSVPGERWDRYSYDNAWNLRVVSTPDQPDQRGSGQQARQAHDPARAGRFTDTGRDV